MSKNEAKEISSSLQSKSESTDELSDKLDEIGITEIDKEVLEMEASNDLRYTDDVKAVVEDRGGNSINLDDGSRVARDIVEANHKAEHNDIPGFLKEETGAKDTGSGERNPDDDPELDPRIIDQIRQQGGNVNTILEEGMTDYDIQMANIAMGGEQELRGTEQSGLMGRTDSHSEEVGYGHTDDDPEKENYLEELEKESIEESKLISAKGLTDKMRVAGKAVDTADVTEVVGNVAGAALVGAAGLIDAAAAAVQGDLDEAKAELAGGAVETGVVLTPGLEYADAASVAFTGETLSYKLSEAAREAVRNKLNPQDAKEVAEIGQDLGEKGVLSKGDVPSYELGELTPSPVGIAIEQEKHLER